MKNIKHLLFLIVFTPVVLNLSSCKTEAETMPDTNEVKVRTASVESKAISLPINSSGKLYSSYESKRSFKIPGIVSKIYVKEGQSVSRNTLMAELDLVEMKARVAQAKSAYGKAQRDRDRANRLYADSVATLEQLQNAGTAMDVAASDLKVAEFNLRHSAIYAPDVGRVLKKFVEEGELINSGTPVLLFGSSRNGWVMRVGVSDKQLIRLQIGDEASIKFDVYPDIMFAAKVTEIEAVANPYTGTFEVKLQVEPTQYKLYSGFIGKVELRPSLKQTYSIIPVESLVEADENKGYVYEVMQSRNEVRKLEVQIEQIFEKQLMVISGLENVEEVVTYGTAYLTDGSRIKIIY